MLRKFLETRLWREVRGRSWKYYFSVLVFSVGSSLYIMKPVTDALQEQRTKAEQEQALAIIRERERANNETK